MTDTQHALIISVLSTDAPHEKRRLWTEKGYFTRTTLGIKTLHIRVKVTKKRPRGKSAVAPRPTTPSSDSDESSDSEGHIVEPSRKDVQTVVKRVPSASELIDLIKERHEEARVHPAEKPLYQSISEDYHGVPRVLCKAVVARCTACSSRARAFAQKKSAIRGIYSDHYGERTQMDLFDMQAMPGGPNKDHKYVFHYYDHFTKFSILRPITNKLGEIIARELRDIWSLFGPPEILQSDNGTEFKNQHVEAVVLEYRVNHIFSTPYQPQTNGGVERNNDFAKKKLGAWIAHRLAVPDVDWVPGLMRVQEEMNRTRRSGTKASPYQLVFNRMFGNTEEGSHQASKQTATLRLMDSDSDKDESDEEWDAAVSERAAEHAQMSAAAASSSHAATDAFVDRRNAAAVTTTFHEGDLVWYKLPKRTGGTSVDLPSVPMVIWKITPNRSTCRLYGVLRGNGYVLQEKIELAKLRPAAVEHRTEGLFITPAEITAEYLQKDPNFFITSAQVTKGMSLRTATPTEKTSAQKIKEKKRKATVTLTNKDKRQKVTLAERATLSSSNKQVTKK